MGAYQLSLHGDGTSNGGSKSSRFGKQGGYHHGLFHPKRMEMHSPPRHSTACCDGLMERREMGNRLSMSSQRASAIVPLQDLSCMGHSFRSEDSESLALWEEKEQPESKDHAWMKLTKNSPKWLDAMRKFDTMKLAPWRSSPVHHKSSLDGPQFYLDRKGSMKSFHLYSNATKRIQNGESRSVRSPSNLSNVSRQSGDLNPSLNPCSQSGELNGMDGSLLENPARMSDTKLITEEDTRFSSSAVAWDISSKPELVVEKERLVNGVAWEIPTDGALKSQTRRASEEVTMNASQCEEDKLFDDTNAIDEEAAGKLKVDETPKLAPLKALQPSPRFAMLSSKEDDDTSPYEALRQRCILKSESAPLDGSLYVILPKMTPTSAPRAQSVITNPEDVSSESFFLKSRSTNDAAEGALRNYSGRVKNSSTPERLFTSLRSKVFRSARPGPSPLGKKKCLGDSLDSSSPRSILCGPDEGSLPSSNPSLRSDSALPTSASQSYSSSGASFDLNDHDFELTRSAYNLNAKPACKVAESRRVSLSFRDFGPSRPSREKAASSKVDAAAAVSAIPNKKLLGCEDQDDINDSRSSPETISNPELWAATFSTTFHASSEQPDSPTCAAADCDESAVSPKFSPAPPARPYSYVTTSKSEEQQIMPSVVPRSRSHHCQFTARLGGMFSPLRLTSSKGDNEVSSNHHSCFVASSTLSPPHDVDDLDDQFSTCASTLELLSPAPSYSSTKERKSKSKSESSKRRPSCEGTETPTMMLLKPRHDCIQVSISKAVKKILSKCNVKRSNSKGKSKMGSPVVDTLPPVDYHFAESPVSQP